MKKKKNFFKVLIVFFVIGLLITNFNIGRNQSVITEAKASICQTYCSNCGNTCILVFEDGTITTCIGSHPQPL